MLYTLFDNLTWRCVLRLGLAADCLMRAAEHTEETNKKSLIIDTDFFSDVE